MDFIYTVDPESEKPRMLIDRHIGVDAEDGIGIIGTQFCRELLELERLGKRSVDVWINSPGGSVKDGYDICAAILNSKCKVDTFNTALAASTAGWIFMCGRDRIMADYAVWMAHNPYGGDNSEYMDKLKNSIATIIAARCGKTVDQILDLMNKTTFMDASECIDYGVCNDVKLSNGLNTGNLPRRPAEKNEAIGYWKATQKIMNSILDNEKNKTTAKETTMSFAKINNHLKLSSAANEDQIMEEITLRESRFKQSLDAANKVSDDYKQKLVDKEKELKAANDKVEELKADMDKMKAAMEADKKKAEDDKKAKEEKDAMDIANDIYKANPEIVNTWKEKIKADPTNSYAILKGIKDAMPKEDVTRQNPFNFGAFNNGNGVPANDKGKDYEGNTPAEKEFKQGQDMKDQLAQITNKIREEVKTGKINYQKSFLK